MRTCKQCGTDKELDAFPLYRTGHIVGRRHTCRDCWNARWSPVVLEHGNRYYHENTNGYRDRAKQRTHNAHHAPGAATVHQLRNRKYALTHPERASAKRAVMTEVRSGRLVRQPCEICGAAAQAHHDDYSKPLDVIWLCPNHHGERHRLLHRYGDPSE